MSLNLRVLVCNVYCKTGATADKLIQMSNDKLLASWPMFFRRQSVWEHTSDHWGDFQLPPLQYEPVAFATAHCQWMDCLNQVSDDEPFRPITCSANGTFTGPVMGDGILANSVASAALLSAAK